MAGGKGKNWIDFAELKARVRFEDVLDRLELMAALERAGDELRGQCPICKRGDEKSKRFSVNVGKQIYHCFACKKKGNILDFTAAVRGTDVHHAALWLRDEFLDKGTCSEESHGEVQERVQEETAGMAAGDVAGNGAGSGEQVPVSEANAATSAQLTEREAWLVQVMAQGVAWYLMDTFTPFHDVDTITNGIMARVEMAAGLSGSAAGNGDPAASPK